MPEIVSRSAALIAVVCLAGCTEAEPTPGVARSRQAIENSERVIVLFVDPGGAPVERTAAIAARRKKIVDALPPRSFELVRAFGGIPGFAGVARPEALTALRRNPDVTSVEVDEPTALALAQSAPLVKAPAARATHLVTGAGVRVAVLDTGIAALHPDLVGSVVAEQCFTIGACLPGNTNTSASANDLDGHGTNVTGIITGDGVIAPPGIAPGTEIVAVRVFGITSGGLTSDWISGLDWVHQNNATLKVKVVNMSLGAVVSYVGNCDAARPAARSAVANLVDAGVVVFASSGNDGFNDRLRSPACNTGVISVGALYDINAGRAPEADAGTWRDHFADNSFGACFDAVSSPTQLTCFTNAGSQLDLIAPGCWISAAVPPNRESFFCGTSQASPTVAGIAALAIQKYPALTPDAIEKALKMTASTLYDPRTRRNYRSVDALALLDELAKRDCVGKPNGTLCSDANACTTGEACQAGACTGGVATVTCQGNLCGAAGTCDPVLGCVVQPLADGLPCNDSNACTSNDKCLTGACVGTPRVCFPATGCLIAATCNATTGNCNPQVAQADGTTCFDSNSCTTADRCQNGVCQGDPVLCPATACREAGTCEASSGTCTAGAGKPDQTSCGDEKVCVKNACVPVIAAVSAELGPAGSSGCSATAGTGPFLLALLTAFARRRRSAGG